MNLNWEIYSQFTDGAESEVVVDVVLEFEQVADNPEHFATFKKRSYVAVFSDQVDFSEIEECEALSSYEETEDDGVISLHKQFKGSLGTNLPYVKVDLLFLTSSQIVVRLSDVVNVAKKDSKVVCFPGMLKP